MIVLSAVRLEPGVLLPRALQRRLDQNVLKLGTIRSYHPGGRVRPRLVGVRRQVRSRDRASCPPDPHTPISPPHVRHHCSPARPHLEVGQLPPCPGTPGGQCRPLCSQTCSFALTDCLTLLGSSRRVSARKPNEAKGYGAAAWSSRRSGGSSALLSRRASNERLNGGAV